MAEKAVDMAEIDYWQKLALDGKDAKEAAIMKDKAVDATVYVEDRVHKYARIRHLAMQLLGQTVTW